MTQQAAWVFPVYSDDSTKFHNSTDANAILAKTLHAFHGALSDDQKGLFVSIPQAIETQIEKTPFFY